MTPPAFFLSTRELASSLTLLAKAHRGLSGAQALSHSGAVLQLHVDPLSLERRGLGVRVKKQDQ
jgi:hypothetical protein